MKNFLKLTVSFVVPNVLSFFVMFFFQGFFRDYGNIVLFLGVPILIYASIQILAMHYLNFKFNASYYITLVLYGALFFAEAYYCAFGEYESSLIMDWISFILCIPSVLVINIQCDFTGVLEHPIFSILLCIIVTAFMVIIPLLAKPILDRKQKINCCNEDLDESWENTAQEVIGSIDER